MPDFVGDLIDDLVSGLDYVGDDDDDVGDDDDDVGADDPIDLLVSGDDEFGARRGRRGAKKAAVSKALVKIAKQRRGQRKARQRQQLGQRGTAMKQPVIILGVDSTATLGALIGALATVTITTTAVDRMRIIDFRVRQANAADFLIHNIQIQRTSLLSGAQAVPADVFAAPDRPPLESPILWPGTVVQLVVENLAAAQRRFSGAFYGIDLDV